jgi:hypothetical protein
LILVGSARLVECTDLHSSEIISMGTVILNTIELCLYGIGVEQNLNSGNERQTWKIESKIVSLLKGGDRFAEGRNCPGTW